MMRKLTILAVAALSVLLLASTALAGKLEEIKQRGVLVAGVKDSQQPFGFVDSQSKQLVGFEIDLVKAIADKLGVKLELKPVTSATRIPMLVQGSVDILAATMTHKFERDEVIDFSITYFMDGQKLLVKKNSGIKSAADLAGKKVGTAKGSTSEQNIKNAQPKCTVLSFETYPEAFLAMNQGKVVAVTTDSGILLGIKNSAQNPDDYEIVGNYISDEPYGLGVPENDSDYRDFVNKALADLWTSGEYKKMYDKWFGPNTKYYLPLDWKMEVWPN